MTDHAELLRRWQRMYNAMDSKHEDKWPKDDDFQKLRQDTHAALAARPVTPAPTLSEAEFTDWFIKNYYGEVVFSDPAWHAKSIYRRARNHASAPEALTTLVAEFESAVNACTYYHTAYQGKVMPEREYESFARLRDETIPRLRAALAAPSTPAAEPVNFAHDDLDGQLAEIQRRRDAAPQAQDSAPEALIAAICDVFGIGVNARTPDAILENVKNATRRSACLSLVEQEIEGESSEEEEDADRPFLPWGAEPKEYITHFRAALAAPSTPAAADIDAAEAVRRAWEGGKALGVALAATQAQASDHVAGTDKMVAADLSDAEIDALFLQFAEANERGAMWIRTYVEGFRHLARAILAANKGADMNADGWIACADRLPDLDVPVFGVSPGSGIAVYTRTDSGEGWLWSRQNRNWSLTDPDGFECDDDYEVTHWRPLFALPVLALKGVA